MRKGNLLISNYTLINDLEFNRSVIYLTKDNDEGSIGFVINKKSSYKICDLDKEFSDIKAPIYFGGPVSVDTIHFIHRENKMLSSSEKVSNEIYWGKDFDKLISLIRKKKIDIRNIKFFMGYSGWEHKQLESEITENSWLVQNNFSLINRRCESELAQICRQEQVSLLPYSPLGGGVLCGKYQGGAFPEGARFSIYMSLGRERQKKMVQRFVNDRTLAVVERVQAVADSIGMNLTTLATAWSKQHDFVASTIIGASHVDQLQQSLAAADLDLDCETMERLAVIEDEIPNAHARRWSSKTLDRPSSSWVTTSWSRIFLRET